MDNPLTIPKSYTVGFRIGEEPGRGREEGDTAPLAFATPYGTDSAYDKRLETLRDWCRGHIYSQREEDRGKEPVEINVENVPTRGFRLTEFATRYSTDNKVFRIADPRGFTLEVYAANFTNMLLNDTVVKGVFEGEYVWARDKSKHWLVSTSDELYRRAVESERMQDEWIAPAVGDLLKAKNGTTRTYVGDFYRVYIKYRSGYQYSLWGGSRVYWYKVFKDKKPKPVLFDKSDHDPKWDRFHVRDKLDKTLLKMGHDESKVFLPKFGVHEEKNDEYTIFFATLEEQEAFLNDPDRLASFKDQFVRSLSSGYTGSRDQFVRSLNSGYTNSRTVPVTEVFDDLKNYGSYSH